MHRKSIRTTLNRAALVAGAIGPMAAAVAQDASRPTIIESSRSSSPARASRIARRSKPRCRSTSSRRNAGERRRDRDQPSALGHAAVVQLPAPRSRGRHGHHPPRDAARARAGPDARAAELEAPPRLVARECERHDRPRRRGRRSQHDSDARSCSSIEVLRDGASAQYGSDAIAGRHQRAPEGGSRRRRRHASTYGQRETSTTTSPAAAPPAGATWTAPADDRAQRSRMARR